jgi:hypothetical protein
MTDSNLATLIRGVCHDVGKMKGIEFHLPATWGMQVPGRWEAGYQDWRPNPLKIKASNGSLMPRSQKRLLSHRH